VFVDPLVRREVEALVDSLTQLGAQGVSEDVAWGSGFPPAEGADDYYTEIWGDWWVESRSPYCIRRIVEIGAEAVPVLCEHLLDQRPTGLVFDGHMPMGGAWFAQEYDWNDGWQDSPGREFHYFGSPSIRFFEAYENKLFPHHFRVGDLCYQLIGCIVNRNFYAARSQPSMCAVLNSPLYAPDLARLTREDWGNITPQALRESLIKDFLTPDLACNERRRRRAGAYARLAYYSPADAVRLVRAFLGKPRVDGGSIYELLEKLKSAKSLDKTWAALKPSLSAAELEILVAYLRSDAHSVPSFLGDPAALRVLKELFPSEDPTREREYAAVSNYEVRDLLGDLVHDDDLELDRMIAQILNDVEEWFPGDTYNQEGLAWGCVERLHRRSRNDEAVMAYIDRRKAGSDESSEQLWGYYRRVIEERTE